MSELVNAFKISATGTLLRGLIITFIDYWPSFVVAFGVYFLGYRDGLAGNNKENLPLAVVVSWMIIVSLADYLSRREFTKGLGDSLELKEENITLKYELNKAQSRIISLESKSSL